MNATYLRYELLRTVRNRRFMLFSLGFPVVLYLLIAAPSRHVTDLAHTGISAPLYYLAGLISFGAMSAMLGSGARIATDRQAGWHRQLRTTPLDPRQYLRAKVLTGYAMAVLTVAVLDACAVGLGVAMPAGRWLAMTGLILLGLAPFAGMGIVLGHVVRADTTGPAIGGLLSLLAFLGGAWFPVTGGVLRAIGEALPSWWLVQASRVALHGAAWPTLGWVVVAAWAVALSGAARWAYRRDTARV